MISGKNNTFTQGTTLTNTQNENYIIVTNFDGVKNNATKNSVVLLDTDTIENVDFEWVKIWRIFQIFLFYETF